MPLILEPFEKALGSLKKGYTRSSASPADEELRDACIQRFEYTFELAWKMLKRQLEAEIANREEVDSYSKKTLFRVGGEKGIIQSVDRWFEYLEKRNLTSHTYNRINAEAVYGVIGKFISDSEALLESLKGRDD